MPNSDEATGKDDVIGIPLEAHHSIMITTIRRFSHVYNGTLAIQEVKVCIHLLDMVVVFNY